MTISNQLHAWSWIVQNHKKIHVTVLEFKICWRPPIIRHRWYDAPISVKVFRADLMACLTYQILWEDAGWYWGTIFMGKKFFFWGGKCLPGIPTHLGPFGQVTKSAFNEVIQRWAGPTAFCNCNRTSKKDLQNTLRDGVFGAGNFFAQFWTSLAVWHLRNIITMDVTSLSRW